MAKTGAPLDKAPQTYILDEDEITYNPKTMAVRTHKQKVQEGLMVKHVLKKLKAEQPKMFKSIHVPKDQLVWDVEQKLSQINDTALLNTTSTTTVTIAPLRSILKTREGPAPEKNADIVERFINLTHHTNRSTIPGTAPAGARNSRQDQIASAQ